MNRRNSFACTYFCLITLIIKNNNNNKKIYNYVEFYCYHDDK